MHTQVPGGVPSGAFGRVFRVLKAGRWGVLAFWLLAGGGMLWPALQFVKATSSKYEAPKDTPGYESYMAYKTNFPDMARRQIAACLITRHPDNNASILTPFTKRLTFALRDIIVPAAGAPPDTVNGVLGMCPSSLPVFLPLSLSVCLFEK